MSFEQPRRCARCGAAFMTHYHTKRFCSHACAINAWSKGRPRQHPSDDGDLVGLLLPSQQARYSRETGETRFLWAYLERAWSDLELGYHRGEEDDPGAWFANPQLGAPSLADVCAYLGLDVGAVRERAHRLWLSRPAIAPLRAGREERRRIGAYQVGNRFGGWRREWRRERQGV